MGLLDRMEQASRQVSDASRNASQTNNLKRKIAYERERIDELLRDIGQQFYDKQDGPYETEKNLCREIDDRKRRIGSMQDDLSSLRGIRVCKKCGARFDEKYTFAFCGNCGERLVPLQDV